LGGLRGRSHRFLRENTRAVPKVTLPAPNVVHYFVGGPKNLPKNIYPDADAFWTDLVTAYRQELSALVDAGARYIQLDDTSVAFICDPAHREYIRSWGDDPDRLLHVYATKMNEILAGLPAAVTITFHQCRGNREGNWAAEGGYDPVAEVLFNVVNVNGYFLEYDTARAGGFEPLRFLPKNKTVVLGLLSSKTPALESVDALMRRIDAAVKLASLDQLAISPQCGFASSVTGNPLTEADQEAKLRRIVEVATRVWGGV
jgi:5-methyltetrahydropteroyltriglutamate--homocysteine methyltransferase